MMTSSLTKKALAHKRATGRRWGSAAPIGMRVAADGDTLESDAAEQQAIEIIRSLRARGMSVRAIVDHLNDHGISARGKRWHPTTINRILRRSE